MAGLDLDGLRHEAARVVARLAAGLETQLGPTWPDGVEVSFGDRIIKCEDVEQFDFSTVGEVRYNGTSLTRDTINGSGIMDHVITDPAKVTVLGVPDRPGISAALFEALADVLA